MKLLAIDDIRMNLEIYKSLTTRYLRDSVFRTSSNAADGIILAKEWQPDVILMDYHMPETDGMEATRILKADPSTSAIPVILITAETSTAEMRTESLESGADAFIQKPVTSLELIAQIRVMYRIRQAELKLRSEQAALKSLLVERSLELRRFQDTIIPMLDNFPAMIWRSGLDGDCDWFNHTWLAFRGRMLDEEVGQGWNAGVHPEDILSYREISINAFRKQSTFVTNCRMLRHDDTWRTVQIHGAPLYAPDKTFTGFLGACYDITDQLLIEEQLRQSQKMESIGILAAGIAHDFNNILTVILGYASMLQMQLPKQTSHAEAAEMIVESSKRASELVRQLLAFSRKQKEGRKQESVSAIIENFRPFLEQALGAGIRLSISSGDSAMYVMADRTMLEQVVMNLAINARDAMPDGGEFSITTSKVDLPRNEADILQLLPGRYVKISFSDTGSGISEEIREKIFDPFFTTKEIGKGTGLGLSIVYGIARHHGGAISIKSLEGSGTTFDILLPEYSGGDDK